MNPLASSGYAQVGRTAYNNTFASTKTFFVLKINYTTNSRIYISFFISGPIVVTSGMRCNAAHSVTFDFMPNEENIGDTGSRCATISIT